jgi:transcription elongation GreA/GreB family factor
LAIRKDRNTGAGDVKGAIDLVDDAIFDGLTPIPQALEQLRLRLLDLTGRNRLLNFKHTAGKSLPLVPTHLDDTFRRLVGSQAGKIAIQPVPDPARDEWVEQDGRMTKPEPREYAIRLGFNVQMEELQQPVGKLDAPLALYYDEELSKHCRKLDREARLAIEETGANMLYLVLGFLEFPDTKDSTRTFAAPLVCVPVRMDTVQEHRGAVFKLCSTGEEVEENLSLREKLKRDLSMTLPDFPDEDDGIEEYLAVIEKEVARKPGWRLRRATTLAILSFANMLLVRDLDPERWQSDTGRSLLLDHPIIRRVFEGGHEPTADAYGKELDLDTMPEANLPLIFDADSSQHSAIVDAMTGKSLVVEGPPGTGKSQTITNIVAACLHAGKSVLFVAEKLAALQVVKSRLETAGLDPFLLELHSNKTSKRQVLDSIGSRMGFRATAPRDLDYKEAQLSDRKKKLREHAELLSSQLGNQLGCTVHQVLWRADRSRRNLGGLGDGLSNIVIPDATTVNTIEFERRRDQIRYLAKQFVEIQTFDATHPFWGFYPESLAPNEDLKIGNALQLLYADAAALCSLVTEVRARFGFTLDNSLSAIGNGSVIEVVEVLRALAVPGAAVDILPNIFGQGKDHQSRSLQAIGDALAALGNVVRLEEATHGKVDHTVHAVFPDTDLAFLQERGLEQLTVKGASLVVADLAAAADAASQSVRWLDERAADLGMQPAGMSTTYAKLKAISAIAAAAPMQDIHLRHEGLDAPEACNLLSRAIVERDRLVEEERLLGERLYLDQAPADTDLRTWILTLRQGAAWYRFLQRPWRVAIKAHKRLKKDKKNKVDAATRLADLEQWSAHRKAREAWLASPTFKALAGSSAFDFQFPLERTRVVAEWLRAARQTFTSLEIGREVFDPIYVNEGVISRLAARASEVVEYMTTLEVFDHKLGDVLAASHDWDADRDWATKLEQSLALHDRLTSLLAGFAGAFAADLKLVEAHALLGLSHELHRLTDDLASSGELARILGAHHANFRVDVRNITAAVRFGRQVVDCKLPQVTKQALCSVECREVLGGLEAALDLIHTHWTSLVDKVRGLATFGSVEPDAWILPDSVSESGCERTFTRFERAIKSLDSVVAWSQYVYARRLCIQSELDPFVQLLEKMQVPADLLEEAFVFRFHASIAESLIRKTPALSHFSAPVHEEIRHEFAALDREIAGLRGKQIAARQLKLARPPTGHAGVRVADKTEMNLLEYLVPQQKPRVTVREMLRRAGESIRELKPCFMMGPQAVARFLHAIPQVFDVVIMDEASQLRPEQAIGAIVRGRQLIVVGDPKQLPPTSFFSRTQDDGGAQPQMAAVDAESILDVASSHFRPIRSLRWHYRSKHESLIAFSNDKFYRGNLLVFPSPYPRKHGLGVRSHYVQNAVYESQMNKLEAARVVDFVVDHIMYRPDESLGVVALNIRQRDLIAELLEERLKSVTGAQEYRDKWVDQGLGLFVKNLENVQGDQRDAIIISTTFGPAPGGTKPHQNFGPISQQGGWRRLNVLFTRARLSILLVTSLKDTDIVVGNGTPKGTEALRDYLAFAATGRLHFDQGQITGGAPESPFEESVIAALRDSEFDCEPQVGVGSFRIDIGVRHPQYPHLFLAGIECDGASYHSGITVRDRDRIRQEILESLGWKGKLWRIWSTEWFRNPRSELRKLVAFLEALKQQAVDADIIAMANDSSASSDDDAPTQPSSDIESVALTAGSLVTDASEEEVSVGDHVTYRDLSGEHPDVELAVMITRSRTDLATGLVAETTPLAQVLLGAVIGERVELRIPGQHGRILQIAKIKKGR